MQVYMKRKIFSVALLFTTITPVAADAQTVKDCPQFHDVFRKAGLPVKTFGYLSWRESRCNPHAVSAPNGDGSRDSGLLQINSSWRTLTARICKRPAREVIKSLTHLSCNIKVAVVLWQDGRGASNWRIRK